MRITEHKWRSENSLQEPTLSSTMLLLGFELRSLDLADLTIEPPCQLTEDNLIRIWKKKTGQGKEEVMAVARKGLEKRKESYAFCLTLARPAVEA